MRLSNSAKGHIGAIPLALLGTSFGVCRQKHLPEGLHRLTKKRPLSACIILTGAGFTNKHATLQRYLIKAVIQLHFKVINCSCMWPLGVHQQ